MHVFGLYGFSKSGLSVKPVLVNEVGGLRDAVLAAFVGGQTRVVPPIWRWSSTRGWRRQPLPPRRGMRTTGSSHALGGVRRTQETSQELEPSGDRQVATLSLLKSFDRQGGDPRLWYSLWCRGAGVNAKEQSGIEMKILTDTLLIEGRHDLLNLTSLASMEMIASGPARSWEPITMGLGRREVHRASFVTERRGPPARDRVAWRLVGEFLGNGTDSAFYLTLFNLRAARVLLRRLGTQDDSQLMTLIEAKSESQEEWDFVLIKSCRFHKKFGCRRCVCVCVCEPRTSSPSNEKCNTTQ